MHKFDVELVWCKATNRRFPGPREKMDHIKVNAYEMAIFANAVKEHVLGEVTVTTNDLGEVVAVTLTNDDHQVERVIWEKK